MISFGGLPLGWKSGEKWGKVGGKVGKSGDSWEKWGQ